MPLMLKKVSFKQTDKGFAYHPGDVLSPEDEEKHGKRLLKLGFAKEVVVADVKEVYVDADIEKAPEVKRKAKASKAAKLEGFEE